jgi:peptide subunit release factor RF-3
MLLARDREEKFVFLFVSPFYVKYFSEKYPELTFKEIDDVHE